MKRCLWLCSGAVAIDLESGAVARAAAASGMPFAVLRAICDPAGRPVPPAARLGLNATGSLAVRHVLAALAVDPAQVPALLRLAADAAVARRSLIRQARRWMRAYP